MNPRERVSTALHLGQPDRVPWCELTIDPQVAGRVMGCDHTPDEFEIAHALGKDNVTYWGAVCPFWVESEKSSTGRAFSERGLIHSEADLALMQFPDPTDEAYYAPAREFLARETDRARCAVMFLGIDPTWRSMGIDGFSYALADNPRLVEEVLDRYVEWHCEVAVRLCALDFDFIWAADDIAHSQGPLFSPTVYHDLIVPRIRKVAERITKPWIYHSDGNLLPVIEDYLSLRENGIHPLEPYSMDIFAFKRHYGPRVCVCGNVDINTLTLGTPDAVQREVEEKIARLAPGGGYIIGSSNSVPSFAKPENLEAMARAIAAAGL